MTAFPASGTIRPASFKLDLAGETFEVARDSKGQRLWSVTKASAQGPIPEDELVIDISDFSQGSGFSFEGMPGTYEQSNGFDASAPGKLGTWPRFATGQSVTTTDSPGWLIQIGLYLYAARGRYVWKYALDDTVGSTWAVLEIHDLGSGNTIAGRPVIFQQRGYFPVRAGTTGSLQLFHELTTQNATVTEVQTIAISGTPTSGTYTVTYDGKTTAAIAYNADSPTVQAALRLIAGLENVTVAQSGTIPNFTHTVTMTGVGSGNTLSSPAQMTSTDGTSGGTHAITHGTTTPGTTDVWTIAGATLTFSTFRVWLDQLRGAIGNLVYSVATAPRVAANWAPAIGSGYAVGDSGQDITDFVTFPYPSMLMTLKTDGPWSFAEDLSTKNELPALASVIDTANGKYAEEANGFILIPHKSGLIRWHPGGWQYIGPEQEGALEGLDAGGNANARGWGRFAGIASYGKYTFAAVNNTYNGTASLVSFQPPIQRPGVQPRLPLVPHTHQTVSGSMEGVAIATTATQAVAPRTPVTFTDDSATGTVAWGNPTNAGANDGSYATAAAGTSHYLKGLNPSNSLPTAATVTGVLVEVAKKAGASIAPTATQSNFLNSNDPSYAKVAAGTGALSVGGAGNTTPEFGQQLTGSIYQILLGLIDFDTSPIPDTATVLSATLRLTTELVFNSTVPVAQARLYDFGASITTADWTAPGTSHTLLATAPFSIFGSNGTHVDFVSETAFAANVNKTGFTRILLTTDRVEAGTVPTDEERLAVKSADDPTAANRPTLTVTYTSGTVDNIVKLVIGGTVSGTNLADAVTNWPTSIGGYTQYGGSTSLWGLTPTVAQVNASDFGVVFSATVATAEIAYIDHIRMTVYYSTPGVTDPSSFVTVLTVDSTRTIATPYIYKLPRGNQPIVNDPAINRQNSNCTFDTPRIYRPSRSLQKLYRKLEFYATLLPATNTPGLQVWATVDDGTAFQLRDSTGAVATITATGAQTLFFPTSSAAVGHYVQLQYCIPATSGGQVGVACDIRDTKLFLDVMASRTDAIETVVVLEDGGVFEDGTKMRNSIPQQRALLVSLDAPNTAAQPYIDPTTGESGYVVVEGVEFTETVFNGVTRPQQRARLKLRRSQYDR